jgi:hypothetical protein
MLEKKSGNPKVPWREVAQQVQSKHCLKLTKQLGPCLLPPQNLNFFKIPRYIDFLDACMKY